MSIAAYFQKSPKKPKPEGEEKQDSPAVVVTSVVAPFVDDDAVRVAALLNEDWLHRLGPVLLKQADVKNFLGHARKDGILPLRENTFRALNYLPASKWKVVIFGQDPYPRAESALGVAFMDGKVKKWSDALSPSLRELFKNVLVGEGLCKSNDNVASMRSIIQHNKIVQPLDWFEYTMRSGVLWLNTALTYESKEELNKHTKWWRPVIENIIRLLLEAQVEKSKTTDETAGLVFVHWGSHAQRLKKIIEQLNGKLGNRVAVRFVESQHPAVGEAFHRVNTFAQVNSHLKQIGLDEVNWLPKADDLAAIKKAVQNHQEHKAAKAQAAAVAAGAASEGEQGVVEEEEEAEKEEDAEEEEAPKKNGRARAPKRKATSAKSESKAKRAKTSKK